MSASKPRFTGERLQAFDNDFKPDLSQHLAAYLFCLPFVAGKVVLDAACGEGYGSRCLAGSARLVIGMDISQEAIREAVADRLGNVHFCFADLRRLSFADESFDVVCCFQVLEHFSDPVPCLQEAGRVLKASGLFILTTPNKLTTFSENPYHVKEYRPDELEELLSQIFPSVNLLGVFGSEKVKKFQASRRRHVEGILRLDPLGLRRLLPYRIKGWAFAKLARVVRSRIKAGDVQSFTEIHPGDFMIAEQRIEEALDLFAICRKSKDEHV